MSIPTMVQTFFALALAVTAASAFAVLVVVALCLRHAWQSREFWRGFRRAWSLKLWALVLVLALPACGSEVLAPAPEYKEAPNVYVVIIDTVEVGGGPMIHPVK